MNSISEGIAPNALDSNLTVPNYVAAQGIEPEIVVDADESQRVVGTQFLDLSCPWIFERGRLNNAIFRYLESFLHSHPVLTSSNLPFA
ncbi:MAG: hypothetical protein IPK58_25675 [Acidobacteria bacterium]|nr:hypothetical protein [Acidobacteriota bacterium]